MTDRWIEYFDRAGAISPDWLSAAVDHWRFSERLHGAILQHTPPGGRILDVGCGPGFTDFWLASRGFQATGIDNEPELVRRARELGKMLGTTAKFEVADASDLRSFYGKFDLAFSIGVLEHFERRETVKLLAEQARCANRVLISIPTRLTRHAAGISDERFYSVAQLKAIVREAGLGIIDSFGYGDVAATRLHRSAYYLLPKALLRFAQNRGYAYTIAVVGER
jgi:SAM-dependent methyltransferase